MSFRYEIRLSGAGGQGLVLVGKILAEAAAIYDGMNATQSQSYGPEARGGASRSEVILSDGDIAFPKATKLDLLLALTQKSCDRYADDLKPGGILLFDSDAVEQIPEGTFHTYSAPITRHTQERLERSIVANIVALGIITGIAEFVSESSVREAIRHRVPPGTEELNLQALALGLSMAVGMNPAIAGSLASENSGFVDNGQQMLPGDSLHVAN